MEDYRTKAVEFIIEMSKNDEKVPTEKEVNDEIDNIRRCTKYYMGEIGKNDIRNLHDNKEKAYRQGYIV